jgi:hypothetical protein
MENPKQEPQGKTEENNINPNTNDRPQDKLLTIDKASLLA